MEKPNEFFKQLCSEWAELAPPTWKAKLDKTGLVALSGIPAEARKQIMNVGGISIATDQKQQLFLSSNYWTSYDESTIYDSLTCFQQFMSDYVIATIVREHRAKWESETLTNKNGISTLNKETGDAL